MSLPSEAAVLLLQATAAGLDFRRDGDDLCVQPSRLAADLVASLQAAKPALLVLLDDGLQARRDLFMEQLAVTPLPGVPAFLFRAGVPYVTGVCFSCGDALLADRYGRCWRCSLAWRLTARVPSVDALSLDEARLLLRAHDVNRLTAGRTDGNGT